MPPADAGEGAVTSDHTAATGVGTNTVRRLRADERPPLPALVDDGEYTQSPIVCGPDVSDGRRGETTRNLRRADRSEPGPSGPDGVPPEADGIVSEPDGVESEPDGVARTVLALVGEVLGGNPTIGVDDDLFELEFDSLMMAKLAARVYGRLGAELPLGAYFEAETIGDLIAAVRAAVPA